MLTYFSMEKHMPEDSSMDSDEADLDMEEVIDSIGTRDWKTLTTLLNNAGYEVSDLGDLIAEYLERD